MFTLFHLFLILACHLFAVIDVFFRASFRKGFDWLMRFAPAVMLSVTLFMWRSNRAYRMTLSLAWKRLSKYMESLSNDHDIYEVIIKRSCPRTVGLILGSCGCARTQQKLTILCFVLHLLLTEKGALSVSQNQQGFAESFSISIRFS